MQIILTYAPLISLGFVVAYLGVVFVCKLIKHKSVKKAVVETIRSAEKIKEVTDSAVILKLREFCKDGIYAVEEMYRTYVGKAGSFKLDSLLKDMQVACIKEGVEFDKDYWINYIKEEVAKMKGVK